MTDIEDERKRFEEWAAGEGFSTHLKTDDGRHGGEYDTYDTSCAWESWLARARLESGWRPIESAPRDGTPILVCYADTYVSNGFLPIAVRWRSYHPNAKGEEDFRDIGGARIRKITHWMPLPNPPKEDGE